MGPMRYFCQASATFIGLVQRGHLGVDCSDLCLQLRVFLSLGCEQLKESGGAAPRRMPRLLRTFGWRSHCPARRGIRS